MESKILTLFTRTPVHVGAGNSVGAVDSPVMRERHTRIPIIPGSSLKGVLADLWFDEDNYKQIQRGGNDIWVRKEGSPVSWLFGQEEYKNGEQKTQGAAGTLLVGEARVLAFPVRSAKASFSWITCPLALARFKRDAGCQLEIQGTDLEGEACYGGEMVIFPSNNKVILEEYCLPSKDCFPPDWEKELLRLLPEEMRKLAEGRFTLVSDEMFSYFCEHACEVVTRVRIDDETGVVAQGALFNQENVPSETLFYTSIAAQNEKKRESNGRAAKDALATLKAKLDEAEVLQVGGDETIGLGYCTVNLSE